MEQPSTNETKKEIFDYMNIHRAMADMKNFRKDYKDPLNFLLNITLEPLKFKIVILAIALMTSAFSLALCLTIYRMLSEFDENISLRHGSFVGMEIFVLVNFWTVLLKYKEMLWFAEVIKTLGIPLTENVVSEQMYKRVHSMILVLKAAVLVNLGLSLGVGLGFTSAPEYFDTRAYLAVWIKENFPDYTEYILFCMHLIICPAALVASSGANTMSYLGYSSVLQLILINQVVEGICESHIPENQRYSSEIFQMSVKTKLKISIMMHSTAARLIMKATELLYIPILVLPVAGVILGGSLMLEFFTNDSSEIVNPYFGLVCFTLAAAISSTLYVSIGQHLKDEVFRALYSIAALISQFVTSTAATTQ